MVRAKNSYGESKYNVLYFSLRCDDCRANQVVDCVHKLHMLPPWKTIEKHMQACARIKDDNLRLSEVYGEVRENCAQVIDQDALDALKRAPLVSRDRFYNSQPTHVYMSIDPAEGGNSEFAVCSFVMMNTDHVVVVAMDTRRLTNVDKDVRVLLTNHIKGIRDTPGCQYSTIVCIIEAQCSQHAAAHIANVITLADAENDGTARVSFLKRKLNGIPQIGIATTPTSKPAFVMALKSLVENKKFGFIENLHTQDDPKLMIEKAILQMSNLTYIYLPNAIMNPFRANKYTISGKGNNQNDDIAMCLSFGVWGAEFTIQSVYDSMFPSAAIMG